MNAADEIFGLITALQRVRVKIRKMDKGKGLSQVFPNTLEDIYQKTLRGFKQSGRLLMRIRNKRMRGYLIYLVNLTKIGKDYDTDRHIRTSRNRRFDLHRRFLQGSMVAHKDSYSLVGMGYRHCIRCCCDSRNSD